MLEDAGDQWALQGGVVGVKLDQAVGVPGPGPAVPLPVDELGNSPGGIGARRAAALAGEVADLLGVPGICDVLCDIPQGPVRVAGGVPGVLAGRRVDQLVAAGQARQPLSGLIQIGRPERSPVSGDGDGHRARAPAVRLGRHPSEEGMDLGEVVDEMVGVAAQRLVRGVDPGAIGSEAGLPIPVQPRASKLQDPLHARLHPVGRVAISDRGHVWDGRSRTFRAGPNRPCVTVGGVDTDFTAVARLLANPARSAIVGALFDGRALTAGELGRVAGVSASTAS
ncbi:MAG: ArsR/SmtB family transcription factor [Mycobacteriales bacterium]